MWRVLNSSQGVKMSAALVANEFVTAAARGLRVALAALTRRYGGENARMPKGDIDDALEKLVRILIEVRNANV
jgi:hypothetical protein